MGALMGAWAGSRDHTGCADLGQHGRCCKEESNLFLHNLVVAARPSGHQRLEALSTIFQEKGLPARSTIAGSVSRCQGARAPSHLLIDFDGPGVKCTLLGWLGNGGPREGRE